jgi:stress-induced morphogen
LHGYELDQGHIKEFIAALGVGLTGQYLEQFGRKLLGGLLGSVLGGMGRTIGRQAASSGMAFATTWAIGQIARQYYGGGRQLDAARLKAAFAPTRLAVINDSARHHGHAGDDGSGESHFTVEIESPVFVGVSRLQRQRMVNAALGDIPGQRVHALAVRARAPGE